MAFRTMTRTQQMLDEICEKMDFGGLRAYVFGRIKRGHAVADIADGLTHLLGKRVAEFTLYQWISKWKAESDGTDAG